MNRIPGITDDGGSFDPRQAAARARRTFTPGTPATVWAFSRLVMGIGLCGACVVAAAAAVRQGRRSVIRP